VKSNEQNLGKLNLPEGAIQPNYFLAGRGGSHKLALVGTPAGLTDDDFVVLGYDVLYLWSGGGIILWVSE
jgi:hypothetical protein